MTNVEHFEPVAPVPLQILVSGEVLDSGVLSLNVGTQLEVS